MIIEAIPSPSISSISIGPLEIRFYALVIVAGIILAWWIADRRYTAKGGPDEVSLDVAVWMVLFGIVGARLYHVITTPEPNWGPNGDPWKALRIWEGGLGIWGAIAAGALGGFIALHRRGLRFAPLADAVAPGVLIGQAIGRFGNWFNQELFGGPTNLPWGLQIDDAHLPSGYVSGTLFHPTFLYESLWCLAMVGVLLWLEKRFRFRGGQSAVMYVILYVLGRLWIENVRIDHAQMIYGLRLNVWTSIIVLTLAIIAFIFLSRYLQSHPQLADIYLSGHFPATESEGTQALDDAAVSEASGHSTAPSSARVADELNDTRE